MSDQTRSGSLSMRMGDGTPGALVVEDEPDIVAFLGAFFRASGLRLEHVDPATVEEVLDAVQTLRVGCVLLDMNLRGTTGFEVLSAIRAHPRVGNIPVLIVSANNSLDVQRRAAALGATDFVSKPFGVRNLFDTVAELTRGGDDAFVSSQALRSQIDAAAQSYAPGISLALMRVLDLAGDPLPHYALKDVEDRLRTDLSAGDVVGATGPDEIAVVFPSSAQSALGALDRIRVAFSHVSLTSGLASFPHAGQTADELYMAADVALNEALDNGDPVAFHS